MNAICRRRLTVLALLAGGVLLLPGSATFGQADGDGDGALSLKKLFESKIVILEIDNSSAVESKTTTTWLTNVEIIEIAGRSFAVGEYYVPENLDDESYELNRGVTHGVAWEAVKTFRVYTEEQFGRYVADLQEHMSQ